MYDVIVAGAGPAGLRCAHLLEKSGLNILVLESKPAIGKPVQCSGLISRNLDRFMSVPESCIEHRVKGAIVHGPGSREIRLEKPSNAAYVIDREAFDRFLASQVKSDIQLQTELQKIRISSDVALTTNKGEFKSRALLGCDGPSSAVRKHFRVEPRELLQGIIAITDEPDRSGHVELFLDRDLCDGFLWKIPRGKSTEYGMLGSRVRFDQLTRFFRLNDVQERRAGIIPVGPCRSYFSRTLLVGDAAAQTKPWSGGGIIYSLTCADHAASTLVSCLKSGDLSEDALSSYEKEWKSELERPISLGMMGRELYKEMDNKQLGEFMDRLAGMELNSLDMDFPLLDF